MKEENLIETKQAKTDLSVGLKNLLGQQKPDEYLQQILDVIKHCNKKQVFELAYKQAIHDARMEIAVHLVDLDPNGTREKLMKKIDDYIKETKFEGFIG